MKKLILCIFALSILIVTSSCINVEHHQNDIVIPTLSDSTITHTKVYTSTITQTIKPLSTLIPTLTVTPNYTDTLLPTNTVTPTLEYTNIPTLEYGTYFELSYMDASIFQKGISGNSFKNIDNGVQFYAWGGDHILTYDFDSETLRFDSTCFSVQPDALILIEYLYEDRNTSDLVYIPRLMLPLVPSAFTNRSVTKFRYPYTTILFEYKNGNLQSSDIRSSMYRHPKNDPQWCKNLDIQDRSYGLRLPYTYYYTWCKDPSDPNNCECPMIQEVECE